MRTRRVAKGLVIFAIVMAVGWVISLILTGHDNGALRILAVLPAAVGITLFRMVPKVPPPTAAEDAVPSAQGASQPAPVDIVDR
jgi:hypothetical protein